MKETLHFFLKKRKESTDSGNFKVIITREEKKSMLMYDLIMDPTPNESIYFIQYHINKSPIRLPATNQLNNEAIRHQKSVIF